MRKLFEIDLHDYQNNDSVFRRPSVRGIIFNDDNKIALVYSKNEKYYKFPGGGIHKDEDKKEALIREVREEVGLIVIPESICEFGSVMRRQKSNISPHTIFEQENFYYTCKVKNQIVEQNLDEYEAEAGFILRFVSLDEAISVNSSYKSEDYFNEIMIKRETKVLQMIKHTIQ
ncbi:MAG: NUDIX hydrolase [Acutalibacteraceae bacterium]